MEEEGTRLGSKKKLQEGEVDYKTKAGTAWSHSYLNQKPWHPLSYPNQRRKWIAEQTHAHRERRAEEISREVHPLIKMIILSYSFLFCLFLNKSNLCSSRRNRSFFVRPLSSRRRRKRRYFYLVSSYLLILIVVFFFFFM